MAADPAILEEDFQGRLNWPLWQRVLAFGRPYLGKLIALIVLGALVAGFDASITLITAWMIDDVVSQGPDADILKYLLVYAGMMTTFAAVICAFILLAGRIVTGVSHDIRLATFSHLQKLPFAYFDKKAVGWLMARLTSDTGRLSRIMGWGLLDIAWGSTVLMVVAGIMLAMHWQLALWVLATVPLLFLTARYFETRMLRTSRAARKANSIVTGAFNENVQGVRTTRSLAREDDNLEEFGKLAGDLYRHSMSNMLWSAAFAPTIVSICSAGIGLALWRGGLIVGTEELSIGTLVAFINYAFWINHPIQELASAFTNIQNTQASAERVMSVLDTEPAIRDSVEVSAAIERFASETRPPGTAIDGLEDAIHHIEFRHVDFAYEPDKPVLREFSLTVQAPATIALVGPTGGGKSTIVSLLCRFYEPTSGEILINGVEYRRRSLHWLQSSLGMVLQQPHLFSGTIRDNIRYGRLDATDAEVEAAARTVFAHDFIVRTKDGYNSEVGEGGIQLSTGQKQLLSLARAILANPRIFVLDEATSSVDTETEHLLQRAVDRVLHGRISFVIAHRLSTIRKADAILVIDGGRIIEQGVHAELIRRGGHYAELYTSQFRHDAESAILAADKAAGGNGEPSGNGQPGGNGEPVGVSAEG